MQPISQQTIDKVSQSINPQRLLDTAIALVEIPSPTLSAGAVADRLAEILDGDGFTVQRPAADWPEAPAVVVHFESGQPGRTLQFDGHLDTVHLPFVPPRVEEGHLYGSGSSDMKGGIAAFVEALRVLQETQTLPAGSVLLTTHDHHEGPWGDRRQVHALIREGMVGDAVLLPEYIATPLPVAGRGMVIFEVTISRDGEPCHEVMRQPNQPDVVVAGAQLVSHLHDLHARISTNTTPDGLHDSAFVGTIEAGEIYNQSPTQCIVQGTRRWVTPGSTDAVLAELDQIFANVAASSGTKTAVEYAVQGDAFHVDRDEPIVKAFQAAYTAVTGAPLTLGTKPVVDDGNTYAGSAGIPALTHGPAATGAHTLNESVSVAELVRVAQVYALTAIGYCPLSKGDKHEMFSFHCNKR